MPRQRKPESAAGEILKMVADGRAKSAKDAIAQRPELANGEVLITQAATGEPGSKASSSAPAGRRASRPTGSGPARLTR